jgi:RAP1 GTPase activating protein 1
VLDGVALRKPEKQQQLGTQMMIFEKKRVVHHAKFGLLYRKAGQLEENEVYSNEYGSPQFVAFLAAIADIVPLKGHTGFRAGLDVKEDLTGVSSGYTKVAFDRRGAPTAVGAPEAALTMEVMAHVAPLLPFDPVNPQQLHRKRHVGNDVVVRRANVSASLFLFSFQVVIFCEGDEPFNPEVLTSNYNHVFLLVRPVPDDPSGRRAPTHYRVCHVSVRGVRPFRPFVPEDGLVPAPEIRSWLLTKVLNAERAAMFAPEFSQKLSRTITTVVGSWVDEF